MAAASAPEARVGVSYYQNRPVRGVAVGVHVSFEKLDDPAVVIQALAWQSTFSKAMRRSR